MTADDKPSASEWSLLDFARQVAGLPKAAAPNPPAPAPAVDAAPVVGATPANAPQPRTEAAAPRAQQEKQPRTPDDIAEMIMATLRAIDGCPERGFVVTVYGSNPWNAMLTIRPEAGRITDRALWRTRVQEIGARLRKQYDLIDR